ncbi:hypothetical protein FA13DRAFT_1740197 [Coprinellus micaceus]|uniref:Uncharacterized protein n=1 Tax=Coprinellus micaceus TaxID=71717 RepID=A0A4Y7SNK3_COPMI|nr:hypothetical protein FA13DRAFT_1740197 [Coprinellus micaceus]
MDRRGTRQTLGGRVYCVFVRYQHAFQFLRRSESFLSFVLTPPVSEGSVTAEVQGSLLSLTPMISVLHTPSSLSCTEYYMPYCLPTLA